MPHFECGAFNHSATSPSEPSAGCSPQCTHSLSEGHKLKQGSDEDASPTGSTPDTASSKPFPGSAFQPANYPLFLPGILSICRLVKRALPRPVPMVSTPQRLTSPMNGISLRPCTTASLCIRIETSWSPIEGIASASCAGRLKRLLSQLPGRFCAPFAMLPSCSILPGH